MQRIIDEINGCAEHKYYFAALILSLAIPDVCLSYEKKRVKNLDSYSEWCKSGSIETLISAGKSFMHFAVQWCTR